MKKISKTWTQSIADSWSLWTPPDRPSEAEIKVYEEILKELLAKKKMPKVMVLGSTSEFRDLCAKYKLPCTVVDYSEGNYQALSLLMRQKPYKEKLVLQDWRKFKPREKYDLILGDYCINVIPKKDQAEFLSNIAGMLSDQGFCMLKTFVRYNGERGDLAERLRFYRTKMKHRPILETVMATMFKSVYNFKTETTLFTDLWKKFLQLYKKGHLKKGELDYFASLNLKDIPLKVYIPFFPEILDEISKVAKLYGVRYATDWFSKDVPIIIFKKTAA